MRLASHSDPQIEGDYHVIDYVAYSGWLWWRQKHVLRAFVRSAMLGKYMWRCAESGETLQPRLDKQLDAITNRIVKVLEAEQLRDCALNKFRDRNQEP